MSKDHRTERPALNMPTWPRLFMNPGLGWGLKEDSGCPQHIDGSVMKHRTGLWMGPYVQRVDPVWREAQPFSPGGWCSGGGTSYLAAPGTVVERG